MTNQFCVDIQNPSGPWNVQSLAQEAEQVSRPSNRLSKNGSAREADPSETGGTDELAFSPQVHDQTRHKLQSMVVKSFSD